MDGIDSGLANVMIRNETQNLSGGRTRIEKLGLGIDQHDGIGTFFHQGAKPFLAGAERFLGLFILGDIREHAVEPENSLGPISAGPHAVADPALRSVWSKDPIIL